MKYVESVELCQCSWWIVVLLLVDIQHYGTVKRDVAKGENVQSLHQLLNQLISFDFVSDVSPDTFLDLLICEPHNFRMTTDTAQLLKIQGSVGS